MNPTLERVYGWMPPWIQNVGVTLYGVTYRAERLGGEFDRYTAEFREREHWPAARFESFVADRLRQILVRAFEQTRYYGERWSALGITAGRLKRMSPGDLPSLPVTPKQDLRERPRDFVAAEGGNGRVLRFSTSGSTGTPLAIYCTADDRRRFYAAREARSFGWANASLRMPRSMIGGRIVLSSSAARPPFYRYNAVERQMYCSAYHIGPRTASEYLAAFNRRRPAVFTGFAYSHYLLARLLLAQGLRLAYDPRALILGSEKLTAEMKAAIAEAFRARAYEEYGASENCVLAGECEHGRLHVHPDFGIVEVLNEDGMPAAPGEEGRIVCTGLANRTQLLVRYDIGDRGVWANTPCSCGRAHLPVLDEVVGRLEDVLVGPDGRQMVRFNWIYYGLPNVLEGQVIQESLDSIRVRLVVGPQFSPGEAGLIASRVRERLGEVRVACELTPSIERTSRGKFKAVVSLLSPEERARAVRRPESA